MDKIFLPKGTDGRMKDTMILHIMSFALVAVLMIMLFSSFGILFRSVIELVMVQSGVFDTIGGVSNQYDEVMSMGLMDAATYNPVSAPMEMVSGIMKVMNTIGYVVTFASMAVTILLVVFMRKRAKDIVEDPFPMENPLKVKKVPYVLLGFLLGAFGGHLFYVKNTKRAMIYLLLGLVGSGIPILIFYTTAISFADALIACFYKKDEEGYIVIEDYPYWV